MSSNKFHSKLTDSIHRIHAYEYADASTRLAAVGFVSTDVGKVAHQLDDNSYWILSTITPITWLIS